MMKKKRIFAVVLLICIAAASMLLLGQKASAAPGVDVKINKVIYNPSNLKCWYKITFANQTEETVGTVKVKLQAELGETVVRTKLVELNLAPGESVTKKVFVSRLVDNPGKEGAAVKVTEILPCQ